MITERFLEQCFKSPLYDLEPLFEKAFKLSRSHFSNVISFSIPGMVNFDTSFYTAKDPYRFPSLSVTGEMCHLNCEHCGRIILKNMIPALTPKKMFEICVEIKERGGKGCLISGGSMRDGSVPFMNFVSTIKRVKKELGLDVVIHTGIVYPKLAKALASADVDAALIDIIGSDDTIKKIYHMGLTVDAFDRSLSLLERNRIPIVPHIVVGIHYGKLKGEQRALQIVSKYHPAALIIVSFTPLHRTPMESVTPSAPLDIARVILAARFMLPKTPLILGCIRPGGEHKSNTDVLAIRSGVNGIAYPSEEGYNFAREVGLDVQFSVECCSLAYRDLMPHLKNV